MTWHVEEPERATRIDRPLTRESRGVLIAYDFSLLPFQPRRVFTITDVPAGTSRGGHAHTRGHQLLSCIRGAVEVTTLDHGYRSEIVLTPGSGDLLLGPGDWSQQTYLTEDAALLVLCSEPYDPATYTSSPLQPADPLT